MNIAQELISNAQTGAKPLGQEKSKPLTLADADVEILKYYAVKHRKKLEQVLSRYFDFDPENINDIMDRVAVMREQGKMSLDVLKSTETKNVNHSVDVRVTKVERVIVDPTNTDR